MTNVVSNGSATRSSSSEIIERPKRRRFSVDEKVRILREADLLPRELSARFCAGPVARC